MTRVVRYDPAMQVGEPSVVAIGVFDGVHTGHQALIRDAVAFAADRGVTSCVVTFDIDPDRVVTPDRAAPQLTTFEDKLDYIGELGPDTILVVGFDSTVAGLSPAQFLSDVLMRSAQPVLCVVGYDFRFGHAAAGDVAALRAFGDEHGFAVHAHELVHVDGLPVTSSRIRSLLATGDVAAASALLGRPHRLHGRVITGRGAGVALGAPTANLEVDPAMAVPGPGVYAGRVAVRGRTHLAGVSVGAPPTFPDAPVSIEAHLLGFSGDLYGSSVVISFLERLRDQRRFDTPEALAAAIRADLRRITEMGAE